MNGKLAVLIPAFNGGELLRRTVVSCMTAGLDRTSYSILVVDNCSDDESLKHLPEGVQVHRNESNLGRLGNWNRAVEIAEQAGFTYAAFLFVGDEWIEGGSIQPLLRSMERSGSVLGMASLRIVTEDGVPIRPGARLTIAGDSAEIDSAGLLSRSVSTGRLPFAPIQANVYRLHRERPLRFSTASENALNGDIEATVQFLQDHPGPVSIQSEPYLIWKERTGRFFTAQDPWFVFSESRRTLRRVSQATGIAVDWKNANAVAMLTAIREPSHVLPWSTRMRFRLRVMRFLSKEPAGLSLGRIIGIVARKVLFGRSYLDLSAMMGSARASSPTLQAVAE